MSVFTRNRVPHLVSPNVNVASFFDSAKSSSFVSLASYVEAWSKQGDETHWLVLQYNPFCWGRRGYCPWVFRTLRRIKQLSNAPRIAVMFHETYVPRWPWRFTVMRLWQKPIFRQICRIADAAFAATENYASRVRSMRGQLHCECVGVGSNIPICKLSQVEARQSLEISQDRLVVGIFGFAHVSRQLGWIARTVWAVREKRPGAILLYVGSQGNAVQAACGGSDMIDAGSQKPERVGLYLRAMDLVLAPFSDGISSRRTSVMSPMQHGVPIASTITRDSDSIFNGDIPASLLLSKARDANTFTADVLSWLAACSWKPQVPCEQLALLYERHFSWSRIAGRMVADLANFRAGEEESS